MQTKPPYQRRIVHISVPLAKRADRWVDDPASPYEDFDGLVELAIRNQLSLDSHLDRQGATDSPTTQSAHHDASRPRSGDLSLARAVDSDFQVPTGVDPQAVQPLTFLTNRSNPFTIAVRILANLSREGEVRWESFVHSARTTAREVGIRLRAEDEVQKRGQDLRRSISWPIGTDAGRSMDKFEASYLLDQSGSGPLVDAMLATISPKTQAVMLTKRGLELARCPSPLMDENARGHTVSPEAAQTLCDALAHNRAEAAEISAFFTVLDDGHARQESVDDAISQAHPNWTENHVVSHRAGLTGRLRDLEVIEVHGRGPNAVIKLAQLGRSFRDAIIKACDGSSLQ